MNIKVLLFVLLILVFSSTVLPQGSYRGLISSEFRYRYEDYQPPVSQQKIGVRGLGMGGTNIAAANDVTAIFWNPAALTAVDRVQATVNGRMNFAAEEHTSPRYSGVSVRTTVTPFLDMNFAGAALPISFGKRRLVVGVAYCLRNDLNSKLTNMQYYYGGGRIKEDVRETGGVQTISPALAIDVLPSLSVGVTYNHVFGTSDFDLQLRSPYADNFLFFQFKDSEEYSGSYLDLGLSWRVTDWLTLGGIMTPGWNFTVKEGRESLRTLQPKSVELDTIDTPKEQLATFGFDIPPAYGFGIAIKTGANTTITADVRTQAWSTIKVSSSLPEYNPSLGDLFDVTSWSVGFEHVFLTANWSVPIRLGYFNQPTPYKDKLFKQFYEGDQIHVDGWSVGLGVRKKAVAVDFAYTASSTQFEWWMTASDYYNNRIYKTKRINNIVTLSFTYHL